MQKEIEFWNPARLSAELDGKWLKHPGQGWLPTGVCFTEKKYQPGNLIFCIRKDKGHPFSPANIQKNLPESATGVVLDTDDGNLGSYNVPVLKVQDIKRSFGRFARLRHLFYKPVTLAITGSAGKSMTTEMLKYILSHIGNVSGTQNNANIWEWIYHYLANTQEKNDFLVLEIAISALDRNVTTVLNSDVVLFTEISEAHTLKYGDIKNVIALKGRLIDSISETGTVILYRDSVAFDYLIEYTNKRGIANIITYGKHPESDFILENVKLFPTRSDLCVVHQNEHFEFGLRASGIHNCLNCLAVIAALSVLRKDWMNLLPKFDSVPEIEGRLQFREVDFRGKHIYMFNDAYNANRASMKAAINFLSELQTNAKRKVLILGDMLELGDDLERQIHQEIGQHINNSDIHEVFCTGELCGYLYRELSPVKKGGYYVDLYQLALNLNDKIKDQDCILFKSSNGSDIRFLADYLQNKKSLSFFKRYSSVVKSHVLNQ